MVTGPDGAQHTVVIPPGRKAGDVWEVDLAAQPPGPLPVLSWFSSAGGNAICRSSQPMVGLSGSSSAQDQALVSAIRTCGLLPSTRTYLNRAWETFAISTAGCCRRLKRPKLAAASAAATI